MNAQRHPARNDINDRNAPRQTRLSYAAKFSKTLNDRTRLLPDNKKTKRAKNENHNQKKCNGKHHAAKTAAKLTAVNEKINI
jgi:hypothetical protein